MLRRASALALAFVAFVVAAEPALKPDGKPSPTPAALRGPIRITADRLDLEQRDVALYRGNVRLVSQDLTLSGDRLELRQATRGEYEAQLTGAPAHLTHAAQGDLPPMSASAARIVYDTRTAVAELTGGVQLERGTDTLASDSLRYDVAARRITAAGNGGGQVRIVIQPEGGAAGALQEKKPPLPQNSAPKTAPAPPQGTPSR